MKKIIVAAVVLLLILVAAPWAIGRMAEKRVNARLDLLLEQMPYLTVVERKWTGGWFTSEQEVTFEMFSAWLGDLDPGKVLAGGENAEAAQTAEDAAAEVPAAVEESVPAGEAPATPQEAPPEGEQAPVPEAKPTEPFRFTVRNRILHGPVLWPFSLGVARVDTRLVLSDEVRQQITEFFGTDEPVRIRSRVGFFGGGSTRFWGDGRTINLKKDEGTITYDDFKFDICYSKGFDDVDSEGRWPRIEIKDATKGGGAVIDKVKFESESERLIGDLYETDFDFTIDKLSINDPGGKPTGVEDIHYLLDMESEGEFVSMGLKFGSGKVTNQDLAGIKLQIDEIHYDFSLRRLHTETTAKLVGMFREIYKKPISSIDPDHVDALFIAPFKEHGLALLTHDPELVIDRVGIVTPEGEGVIKGTLRLKGVTEADLAAGPMGLVSRLEADITIEVAQKLIEAIPNGNTGAGLAVDQGFAKREGEKLVSRIEFKNSELTINGKPQPIPGLGEQPAPTEAPPEEGMPEEGPPEE